MTSYFALIFLGGLEYCKTDHLFMLHGFSVIYNLKISNNFFLVISIVCFKYIISGGDLISSSCRQGSRYRPREYKLMFTFQKQNYTSNTASRRGPLHIPARTHTLLICTLIIDTTTFQQWQKNKRKYLVQYIHLFFRFNLICFMTICS